MSDLPTTGSIGDSGTWSGRMVGPYRLLSVLGEGGFGQVWLAEQKEPVERRIALKVIRPGVDPQKVLARFEAEGQALALMDHPGVAKVLDAGLTSEGLPYFALEYVRGPSITEFADAEGLGLEDRVRLMIQVCEAVHHAHMKGVVHRDLKPGNILVERIDGRASPKVIDFGIAKALHRPLTDRPLHTEAGQVLGTPEYMSPEQARGGADVDTRADVYSLGAILYELLTGTTPLDGQTVRQAGLGAILRQIEEVEPERPSTRVVTRETRAAEGEGAASGNGAVVGAGTGESRRRSGSRRAHGPRIDPATLSRRLRGELDWIAMKCLEKERSRRYDSAGALARDLQRFLSDEPVEAGPPSTSYRLSKFVRRNRALVGAIAAAFVVLIGATAATLWSLEQAVRGRAEAERERGLADVAREAADRDRAAAVRERSRAESESADAVRARDEAEAVTTFLTRMIESVEPDEMGHDVTVREVLDKASAGIGESMADRPLVEARLRQTIGNSYRGLGEYGPAEVHLTTSLEILLREAGESDRRTLRVMMNLAGLRQEQGRYTEAAALGERALAALEARGDGRTQTALGTMNNLALAYADLGRLAEAGAMMERTVGLMREVLGPDHPNTLGATSNAGFMLAEAGDFEGADRLMRESYEGWVRVHGAEHPGTLLALSNLAGNMIDLGREEEGLRLYQQVYEARVRVLTAEHPDTLRARINVGYAYEELGRIEDAEREYVAAWEATSRVLGPEHPDTLTVAMNVADLYSDHGWPPLEENGLGARMEGLVSSLRAIARQGDATASELNSCAWILLTIEPVSLRDGAAALAAATRACEMERVAGPGGGVGHRLWEYLDTLASALALTGDLAGARLAQMEALERLPPEGERYRGEMEARLREYGSGG